MTYFPLSEYWAFYTGFVIFILGMLFLDLKFFHKNDTKESGKAALGWTAFWVGLALVFNLAFYFYVKSNHGADIAKELGLQFLTGFVIEKALAIDNVFVFLVIFSFFHIPKEYQHRVLFYGILGALFFRAVFIALGAALLQYQFVLYLFGAFLIGTGIKILFAKEKTQGLGETKLYQFLSRHMRISHKLHGHDFWFKENGLWYATPLLVALIFIEISDIVFALDSVPAIFAITKEPFIVFTSNIFAILGLRALYVFIAEVVTKFYLLKYALGSILIFVGLKMVWLNDAFDGHFPIGWSLGIIAFLLVASIVGSLMFPQSKSEEEKILSQLNQ